MNDYATLRLRQLCGQKRIRLYKLLSVLQMLEGDIVKADRYIRDIRGDEWEAHQPNYIPMGAS